MPSDASDSEHAPSAARSPVAASRRASDRDSGVVARANVILTGDAVDDRFGDSVSGAGDVNGDGYGDVLVGARYYDHGSSAAGGIFSAKMIDLSIFPSPSVSFNKRIRP